MLYILDDPNSSLTKDKISKGWKDWYYKDPVVTYRCRYKEIDPDKIVKFYYEQRDELPTIVMENGERYKKVGYRFKKMFERDFYFNDNRFVSIQNELKKSYIADKKESQFKGNWMTKFDDLKKELVQKYKNGQITLDVIKHDLIELLNDFKKDARKLYNGKVRYVKSTEVKKGKHNYSYIGYDNKLRKYLKEFITINVENIDTSLTIEEYDNGNVFVYINDNDLAEYFSSSTL